MNRCCWFDCCWFDCCFQKVLHRCCFGYWIQKAKSHQYCCCYFRTSQFLWLELKNKKKSDLLEEDEFPPKRDVPLLELVFPPPNEKLLDVELLFPPNIPPPRNILSCLLRKITDQSYSECCFRRASLSFYFDCFQITSHCCRSHWCCYCSTQIPRLRTFFIFLKENIEKQE